MRGEVLEVGSPDVVPRGQTARPGPHLVQLFDVEGLSAGLLQRGRPFVGFGVQAEMRHSLAGRRGRRTGDVTSAEGVEADSGVGVVGPVLVVLTEVVG